jgi:hypothetical protein
VLYPPLAGIANRWNEALGIRVRYPETHADFLKRCHRTGQTKPTPLLLQYGEGDYNCQHHDLYGEHVFPLQVAFLLSDPARDFIGGEFVLTEQRPRMESRAEVAPLRRGDGVIFRFITARCTARVASTASTCATASAVYDRATGTLSALSSTTRSDPSIAGRDRFNPGEGMG